MQEARRSKAHENHIHDDGNNRYGVFPTGLINRIDLAAGHTNTVNNNVPVAVRGFAFEWIYSRVLVHLARPLSRRIQVDEIRVDQDLAT